MTKWAYGRMPGITSDREPIDSNEYCEWCHEPANDDLNEWHNLLICSRCVERKRESEEENAKRYAYSDRVVNDLNRRKT